jgi:hypothetical protein
MERMQIPLLAAPQMLAYYIFFAMSNAKHVNQQPQGTDLKQQAIMAKKRAKIKIRIYPQIRHKGKGLPN